MSTDLALSARTKLCNTGYVSDEGARRIAHARGKYDEWYRKLVTAIREEAEVSVKTASERADFSREYIGQIRAGKAGDKAPRQRARSPRCD